MHGPLLPKFQPWHDPLIPTLKSKGGLLESSVVLRCILHQRLLFEGINRYAIRFADSAERVKNSKSPSPPW